MLWENLAYFLKAVIPVAEKAGVRLALHPNDPPVQVSHGNAQIIATFNDWKRLIELVDSPSNGMTYDCGVCREMGEDPAGNSSISWIKGPDKSYALPECYRAAAICEI